MNKKSIITMMLALVAVAGLAKTKTAEVKADSLLLFVQAGDSCMQQYNTFEALKYYQEAYAIAKKRSQHLTVEQPNLPLDKFDELPEEKQCSQSVRHFVSIISLLNGAPLHLTLKGMQDIVFRRNIWMIGKLVVTLQLNIHANTYLSWQQ